MLRRRIHAARERLRRLLWTKAQRAAELIRSRKRYAAGRLDPVWMARRNTRQLRRWRARGRGPRVKMDAETRRLKQRAKEKRQWERNPTRRLAMRLRARLRHALAGRSKCESTQRLLGCTWLECREWLTKKFLPGMTWENRSGWHIDHIIPCAAFDLADPAQQRACFHYTNLQPLWKTDNLKKGVKLPV